MQLFIENITNNHKFFNFRATRLASRNDYYPEVSELREHVVSCLNKDALKDSGRRLIVCVSLLHLARVL